MRIRKRLLPLLLAAVLMCSMSVTAYAHDVPDLTRKGSVTVTMRQGEDVVPGGTLTLYRVGAVYEDDGNYSFVLTGDFMGSGEALENIQSAGLAKRLAEYAGERKLAGMTKTIGTDGTVSFTNLEPGLYLLAQYKAAAGYSKADPFLVSVPMLENGVYHYGVDASPKVGLEVEPEPTTPEKPPEPSLPNTGQLNWPVPVLATLGLCLFAAGWALCRGKKKNIYEK